MLQENVLLVKLAGEISLKSDSVKQRFTEILRNNIEQALKTHGIEIQQIRQKPGRMYVFCSSLSQAAQVVQNVFGVNACAPAYFFESTELKDILETTAKYAVPLLQPSKSFAVRTKREGKHTFSSPQVSREAGSKILEKLPKMKVNLSEPEQRVDIEIRDHFVCVFTHELKGLDGLPVGTSGKVAVLFSGSREDVLACLLMLKRGCKIQVIFPSTAEQKTLACLEKLKSWNSGREILGITLDEFKRLSEHPVPALVHSAPSAGLNTFQQDEILFLQTGLPVLRPLVLFSPEMIQEKLKELGWHD